MTKTTKPGRGLSVTGKTREAVTTFFKNMFDRRFSEAEKTLTKIKDRKFTDEGYKTGYLNALEGLLLSVRSGDERDFYNRNHFNKKNMKAHIEEFKEFRKNPIRTQFDSGFFAAWSDIMQYRANLEKD